MDIKTVIVPLDDSERARKAVAPASAIARATDAELVLYSQVSPETQRARLTQRERELEHIAARLEDVETQVRVQPFPSPAAGIEDLARSRDGTLVCMSSHARERVSASLLGSVAEEVLGRLAAPVLLVGPQFDQRISPIEGALAVCVDGSPLSEAILDAAVGWARTFAMDLRLVQVVSENWTAEVAAAGIAPTEVREGSYLGALTERLGTGVDVDWDVIHGRDPRNPVQEIVETARAHRCGLLALSTHGRTGLRRLRVGSVAMGVVHDAPCAVLVARPAALEE